MNQLQELRTAILKQGKVTMMGVRWTEGEDGFEPIKVSNQEIVEIGIDDLLALLEPYVAQSKVDSLQEIYDVLDTEGTTEFDFNLQNAIEDKIEALKPTKPKGADNNEE